MILKREYKEMQDFIDDFHNEIDLSLLIIDMWI